MLNNHKYTHLLPAPSVKKTAQPGRVTDLEATEPGPTLPKLVGASGKTSNNSENKDDSKALREATNTTVLPLVYFLSFFNHLMCLSIT